MKALSTDGRCTVELDQSQPLTIFIEPQVKKIALEFPGLSGTGLFHVSN